MGGAPASACARPSRGVVVNSPPDQERTGGFPEQAGRISSKMEIAVLVSVCHRLREFRRGPIAVLAAANVLHGDQPSSYRIGWFHSEIVAHALDGHPDMAGSHVFEEQVASIRPPTALVRSATAYQARR